MAENIVFDTENNYAWDSIYTLTDDVTQVVRVREIFYDTGLVKAERFYPDGHRANFEHYDIADGPDDSGIKNWTSIHIAFDQSGTITVRDIGYDNGLAKSQFFEAGVRAQTVVWDNNHEPTAESSGQGIKIWTSITTDFDLNGVLESRETIYDNGVAKVERYESGQLSEKVLLDNVDEETGEPIWAGAGAGASAKAWKAIQTEYDENGLKTARIVVYDNDIAKMQIFENEKVSLIAKVDNAEEILDGLPNSGIKEWSVILSEYDESGDRENKLVAYDNGDFKFHEFEDGDVVTQALFDGDGSESWLLNVSTYDALGAVVSDEFYYTEEEIPDEFFEQLGKFEDIFV